MTDHKMNGLIKNLLIMSLTLELKRMPTNEELFEAIMELYHDTADMEKEERDFHEMKDRLEAFIHNSSSIPEDPNTPTNPWWWCHQLNRLVCLTSESAEETKARQDGQK